MKSSLCLRHGRAGAFCAGRVSSGRSVASGSRAKGPGPRLLPVITITGNSDSNKINGLRIGPPDLAPTITASDARPPDTGPVPPVPGPRIAAHGSRPMDTGPVPSFTLRTARSEGHGPVSQLLADLANRLLE